MKANLSFSFCLKKICVLVLTIGVVFSLVLVKGLFSPVMALDFCCGGPVVYAECDCLTYARHCDNTAVVWCCNYAGCEDDRWCGPLDFGSCYYLRIRYWCAPWDPDCHEYGQAIWTKQGLWFPCDDCDSGCFAPETMVATPRGQKAIQDLEPGDSVVSFDPEGNEASVVNEVKEVHEVYRGNYFKLKTALGEEVEVTGEHPLFSVQNRPKTLVSGFWHYLKTESLVNKLFGSFSE